MEFSGRLSAFPPANLLQWAAGERRTGALVVRHGEREKRIYFRGGDVVGCVSTDPHEYYGQRLLLYGYVNHSQLVHALDQCSETGKRLGSTLVDLGMISEADIQQTLREHVEDAICDLFLWRHGVFFFEGEMPSEEEILPEPIHTVGLVMEGSRWIDEYSRIRRLFPHDNVVLKRGTVRPGDEITSIERRILGAVDGESSLAQLYKAVRGSHFRFLEAAFNLSIREALDVERVDDPDPESEEETQVIHLLDDQADAESGARTSRHLAIPLEVIQHFYPVWVRPLRSNEEESLSPPLRAFVERLDGSTALADALDGDPETRARQIDFLILKMRDRRLAFMPSHSTASKDALKGMVG